jgi:hypothetical protein
VADEKTGRIAMPDLKLLVWNVEWMNDLFVSGAQPVAFKPDDAVPSHHRKATVRKRRDDLSGVIQDLSPITVECMENSGLQWQALLPESVKFSPVTGRNFQA